METRNLIPNEFFVFSSIKIVSKLLIIPLFHWKLTGWKLVTFAMNNIVKIEYSDIGYTKLET